MCCVFQTGGAVGEMRPGDNGAPRGRRGNNLHRYDDEGDHSVRTQVIVSYQDLDVTGREQFQFMSRAQFMGVQVPYCRHITSE